MLRNYLKVAFRSLLKNKFSSLINVFGLSIGMCSCLLIGLYIRHELSYDRFQKNGDRIARVIMEYKFDGAGESKAGNFTSTKVAPAFKKNFPEVADAVRMTKYSRPVQYRDKFFNEPNVVYADPSFFHLFDFDLVRGSQQTALSQPNEIIFSSSSAKKYFGKEDPLGKLVTVGSDTIPYKITGVIADAPTNSQVKYDFIISFASLHADQEESYFDANYTTYLLLRNESSLQTLQQKIAPFMQKEMAGKGASINFNLEPFLKIHLHSEFDGFEPNSSLTYVYIIGVIGLLILVIACFTYINLSTARSIERAKEVSVRKVIGAEKSQLFWQFIGESALVAFFAAVLSYGFAIAALPWFRDLTQRQLEWSILISIPFLISIVIVVITVTLLAGSYPAMILSGFEPVKGLKGSFKNTGQGQWMRNSLIVFQFFVSVFLIIATFIIQNQLYFIQHKKLGFDRDHVLVLPMDRNVSKKLTLIKQELRQDPTVIRIARSNYTPVNIMGGYNMRSAAMPENSQLAVNAEPVDEDYLKTVGIELIAGEDFITQDVQDVDHDQWEDNKYHFILNETAARTLGWTAQQAVGKKMFLDNSRPGIVRGVVRDFHFESMHQPIRGLVLFPEIRGRNLLVRIDGRDLPRTINFIKGKWETLVPTIPFSYHFLDEDYNKLYSSEIRLSKVMDVFSGIAIVLACLGLFGLASYSIQQRRKEVSIRKVLGASESNLVFTLSRNFLKLSTVAILLAFPVTWFSMNRWLQDFSYRISIQWWIFAIAAAAILLLVFITVSFHVIRAAIANPVKNLRD